MMCGRIPANDRVCLPGEKGKQDVTANRKKGYVRNYENWLTPAPADICSAPGVSGGEHQFEADGNTPLDEPSIESIVSALESLVDDVDRLIDNRSPEDLRTAAKDGGWGVVEVLAHLHDWEEITHERVWQILEEDNPAFVDYDDSMWAIEHEYGSQDPHQVFAHITKLRCDLVAKLRELEEDAWNWRAMHPAHGEITLRWFTTLIIQHDAVHVAEIREVLS